MDIALIVSGCIAAVAVVALVIRSSSKADSRAKAEAAELARQRGVLRCPNCGHEGPVGAGTKMGPTGRLQPAIACRSCGVQLT